MNKQPKTKQPKQPKTKQQIFLYIPVKSGVIDESGCLFSIQNELYRQINEITPINKVSIRKNDKDYTISFNIKTPIEEAVFQDIYNIITTYLNNTADISQFYIEENEIKYKQLKANNNELQAKPPTCFAGTKGQLKFIDDDETDDIRHA